MATRVPPNTENPFIVAQRGNRPDPFRPWTPSMPETPSLDGMVGLAKAAQAGLYASIQAPPEPQRQAGPTIRWSPAKQSFYVQGEQFEGRDARMALETEPLLGQPPAPEPGEGDWIPVPAEQYTAYLESIKNPTRGRLFSQNFEMGVDQLKQLGGSALQAVGAEETGQAIVNRAEERIQQVSPYAREFTGISEAGEGAALDWFVSVLGNQGPMILFSVATAIAGGGIGAVAGRGALAAKNAGMVSKAAQAMGRKEYAQKVMDAAAKYSAGAASKADKAILRQAAAFTGAAAGTFAGSMAIGTGDIYGEMRAEGAEPGVGSSLKAISGSIPYAALETLTEFLIAGRLLGFKGFAKQPKGMSALRKGAGYAGRAAAGVGIFGTTEALTEGSQEAIVLGLSGQNMLDDAAIERYINGMAAGFAVGGVLGGAANLRSKYEPADLMQNDGKEETPPPATPPAAPVGDPTVEYTGPEPRGSGPQGVLPFSEFSQLERARRSAQDTTTTPQLVWNPETLRYDLQGPESDALQLAPPQFEPNPDQGQLQFGPEAPATPAFGQPPIPQSPRAASPTPMAQAMQRASVDNAFLQAQQEQTLLRDDQYSRMEAMGRAQEQVNLLTPEERAVVDQQPEQAQLPMAQEPATPAEPAAPQQLPLFNQRQTPRPSRADRLRRGIDRSQQAEQELLGQARATALDIAADAQGLTEAGRSRQGNLFTQQGQPTVAALKSAGERIRRPQPVVEPSEPQTRPVRGLKKKAAAKKATAKKPLKKEKPDAVQERSAAQVDAREQASTGERVRGKDTQASQPARKSRAKEKPQESKPAVQQKQAVQKVAPLPAEEAWTDMAAAVDVYLPYSELSEADQRVWQAALDENAASPALAEQLFDAMEVTERQEFLADVQAIVQNADDMNMFTESVSNVVYHAFFDTNQNNAKNNTIPEARDFLQEREFNRNQQAVLNEIFLRQAGEAQRRDAFKQGKPQPWFSFAHSRGLLSLLPNLEMRGMPADLVESLVRDKHIGFRNLPESVWKKLPAELRGVAPEDKGPQVSPGARLAFLIEDTNDSRAVRNPEGFKKLRTQLAELWEQAQDKKQEDFQTRFRSPLKDYFDEDGTPRVFSINGRPYVSNVPLTDEQRLAMAKVERDASRAAQGESVTENETGEVDPDVARTERAEKGKTPADEPPAPRWTLDSWTTGRASMRTTDGKNITGPLPMNKVKTILSGFVNRLAKRPKFWLFKNQADLKKRNPELYKKAKAGRNVFRYAATNIETRDSKGGKVRVYINPSVAQIKSMASAYRGKIVPFRYILDDKGDFFVWDANESLHEWMVHPLRKLGARIGNRERGVGEGWIRYHRNTDSVNRFQYDVDNAEQAANDTTIPDLPYDPPSNTINDFDTMEASGYSFDKQVIIFTDRIFTTQQLKFVMAHETMGHFGLRGFIPQKKFDSLMLGLYDDNPRIRNDVDVAMNARPGMGKAEAVEEYLSDYAALLDTSIIARIWDALKGVFNRLNIQFGDESVRYFVHQARRYARTGKVSNAFEMQQIFDKLHEIEYGLVPPGAGRFSALDADFAGDMRNYGSNAAHIRPYDFTELDKAWDSVKKFIGNTAASFDKFKAKFFSLSNFRALENPGLYEFETLMDATRNVAMSIKVGLNEKLRDVLNKAVFNKAFGIKDEQIEFINDTLYDARMWAIGNLKSEAELGRQKLFYLDDNGEWQRSVDADGVPLVKKLADRGRISFEMMRDGFDYVVEDPAGDATKSVVLRHKGLEDWKAEVKRLKAMTNPNKRDLAKAEANVEILSNLTEDSLEWTGYNDLRDAVNELEEQLLLARYIDATNVRKSSFEEISTLMVNERLTKDDRDFINKTMNVFKDTMLEKQDFDERGYPRLNKASVENAYEFIKLLNAAVIGQQTDRIADLEKFMRSKPDYFRGKLPDDILSGMEKFRERVAASTEAENKYVLQDKLKEILLSEISKDDADLYTKRSLATGYVPVIREGSSQVRVVAVNAATGQNVTLMENYRERLVYSMFDKPSEAKDMADYLNQQLRVDEDGNQKTYEVMAYDRDQQKFTMQKVRLLAIAEDSKTEVAGPLELNLNEFIRGLRFFDMQVTPAKMQAIVTQLTSQNAAARKRLQFSMTPGDKREGIKAISRHIESRASTIAKTMFRSQLTDLMNLRLRRSQQLWNATETVDVTDAETGKVTTKKKVDYLREYAERLENDPDAPEGARANARRTYERYKYMVDKTDAADVIKHGNRYWNEASRTMAFLDANKNVDESDFGSGRVVSRVRAAASLMQLGGSIATGSLNIIALYTNAMPYLATYNRKNGFGGGFGAGRSLAYLHVALKQVGALGIGNMDANRAEFYDEVAQDKKLQQRYGLEEHEARFIAQEIREGVMIPALSNALVGTARGFATTGARQKFIDTWMLPFNLTEQASRRSLGLASYRLEYARQLEAIQQEGIPLTNDQLKQARDAARRFAVDAIQMTMGEYSVLNRPAAWRSGLQSFMYMYKVFPTTSIQLMSRLSRTGQISMLTSLWLLGGMAATPFAEDIEDLVDTIAQALGFKAGSIRYEIAKAVDDLLPGMSPYVLGGFTNAFTHGNLGTRVALGNFIPGTGILLSGANVGRELVDIGGPAPSAIIGTANSLADLARAPFKANTGQALLDVAREAPVTMVRAAGDAYAFHQTGAIIDRRGYIVSEEAGKMTIAARLLGFYPVAASEQYDTIRMAKRIGDYQRDTVAAFRQSWIKARMAGDYAAARDVEAAVRDWNRGLRGSALEIKNFRAGSVRALREAQRPATERLRKGAARTARDDIDRIADLLSY